MAPMRLFWIKLYIDIEGAIVAVVSCRPFSLIYWIMKMLGIILLGSFCLGFGVLQRRWLKSLLWRETGGFFEWSAPTLERWLTCFHDFFPSSRDLSFLEKSSEMHQPVRNRTRYTDIHLRGLWHVISTTQQLGRRPLYRSSGSWSPSFHWVFIEG